MRVLIVEDNPGDLDLVMQILKKSSTTHAISVAVDGVDALAQLRGEHGLPDLIILDLNLPKKDGRELLGDIKSDPLLCSIPVVVFSSSAASSDLAEAYRLHANCFVTKPPDLDDFIAAVQGIDQFWLQLAKLPPMLPRDAS